MENNRIRRDILNNIGLEESIVFENPDYDSAIVGYDANDYRVVYDFEKMVEYLMDTNGMTYEDAVEFIEYNTIRAIPYAGPNSPIVVYNIEDNIDYLISTENTNKYEYKFNAEEHLNKCVEWTRQWFEENGKGCNAVIGMSGGKDSTIVAAILCLAIGCDRVIGVAMPDEGQGINDADKICEYLGIKFINMPIGPITERFKTSSENINDDNFKWSKQTEQNIPPRVRMTMLYAIAQTFKGRVIGTTNLDERLTGYFTKFGDGLACDIEPIEMLTVSEILEMGELIGLPSKWLYKVPSADLPNTLTDEEELGFSYKDFDLYIRNNRENLSTDTINRIEERIRKNRFKLKSIEHYEPEL